MEKDKALPKTPEDSPPTENIQRTEPLLKLVKNNKFRLILLGFALISILILIITGGFIIKSNKNSVNFCTQELKLCPDGETYVGRHGSKCKFSECSSNQNQTSISTEDWNQNQTSISTEDWNSYQGILYGKNDIRFSIKYPEECELDNSGFNKYMNLPVSINCDHIPAELSIEGTDSGINSIEDDEDLVIGKYLWERSIAEGNDDLVYSYYRLNQIPYGKSIVIRYDDYSEIYQSYLEEIISTFTMLETVEPENLKNFRPHAFDITIRIPQNWNINENNNELLYIANHPSDTVQGEYTPNLKDIVGLIFYKNEAQIADFNELKKIIFKGGFDEDTGFTTVINEEKLLNLNDKKVLYRETSDGISFYYLIFPSYYIEIIGYGDWKSYQSEIENIISSIQPTN